MPQAIMVLVSDKESCRESEGQLMLVNPYDFWYPSNGQLSVTWLWADRFETQIFSLS